MRAQIVDFDQLSDSREMLEGQAPNFMIVFIYFLLIMLIVAFAWMWFGEMDVIIKANGIVRPESKISIIRNVNGGMISDLNYQEGEKVNKGDTLYIIDSSFLNSQIGNLKDEQIKHLKDIESLNLLKESYIQEENLIGPNNSEFNNRYLVYQYNFEQLALDLSQAERRYNREQSLSSSSTTEIKLEELETSYRLARLALERFKSEALVNVKNEIKNVESRLKEIESQIEEVENRIKLNHVKAPINGTIQIVQEFNMGDYMPSGVEVLRLIPDGSDQYKIEIMVQNKDISQLFVDQKVNYRFLALPYKEYGTLDGNITKISEDAILSQAEANMAYKVEGNINDTNLYDKEGNLTVIKTGMLCEVRVVVRQKKILHYVLEKLDFIS